MTKNDRSADGSGSRPVPGALRTAAVAGGCLLVLAGTIALLAWVLIHLAPLTLAVIAALLLAALLNPVAAVLRRLRLPGWLAALNAVLFLLAIVVGPLALLANQAIAQFADVEQQVLQGIDETRRLLVDGPLPINDRQLDSAVAELGTALQGAAPDPVSGATTALQTLASLAIALVLLYFLLRDGTRMWQWLVGLVPARRRDQIDDAARDGWATMVAYVRGTVIVAAVDAVGIGIALLILDVPLALALAFLTFLFAFIPIVGAIVAGAAAVLVALVSNGLTDALLVLAAVLIVQQVESNLLQPFIMGKALRLHPAVVLLAVSTGTLVGGIAGAVVAVPLTAVTYRVADRAYNYHPPEPPPEASNTDGRDTDGDEHPHTAPPDHAPTAGGRRPRWPRRAPAAK
jgi:predicted PurR-regulated permease PerM